MSVKLGFQFAVFELSRLDEGILLPDLSIQIIDLRVKFGDLVRCIIGCDSPLSLNFKSRDILQHNFHETIFQLIGRQGYQALFIPLLRFFICHRLSCRELFNE